jgi:hypothetical protein
MILLLLFLASIDCANAFEMPVVGIKGPQKSSVKYDGSFLGDLQQGRLTASSPIYQDEHNLWTLSGLVQWMVLDTDVSLPREGTPVPQDFYNIQAGVTYTRYLEGEKFFASQVTFGSASDTPFASGNVDILNVTGMYGFQSSESSQWLFLLNYSNNRSFANNIPIPGFAYTYMPSKTFRGVFGIPIVSIFWMPTPKLMLTSMLLGPWMAKSELGYFVLGPVRLFTGFDFKQQLFLRKDRPNPEDRFSYNEKRALLGVKSPLSQVVMAELALGYAFDRSLYETDSYFRRDQKEAFFDSTWFFNGALSANF